MSRFLCKLYDGIDVLQRFEIEASSLENAEAQAKLRMTDLAKPGNELCIYRGVAGLVLPYAGQPALSFTRDTKELWIKI